MKELGRHEYNFNDHFKLSTVFHGVDGHMKISQTVVLGTDVGTINLELCDLIEPEELWGASQELRTAQREAFKALHELDDSENSSKEA